MIDKDYKETKIGIIPKDWDVVRLGDVLNEFPKYGIGAPSVEYSKNLPTYIRITDIDENGCFKSQEKVSVEHKDYKKYILKENEIVFARTGASVGKSYLYNKNDGVLVYAGFLIKISPNIEKINSVFLANIVNTNTYWNWVKIMSLRSGQPGINSKEYSGMRIPLPPLKEQEKIAEILTLWDNAILKQSNLIDEKEKLKKRTYAKIIKFQNPLS
ncbi:restriction endonuclease subunit S [Campylobacter pinnipediorum]|uniref:restriction endonuclease subunit S n=1 Tax=Campylobacter pinnipediorum TaxID=1965231 RepID=UPI0009AE9B5D|nr:restriction endonuclease subunit S [Campylobacter pinnipediorum]